MEISKSTKYILIGISAWVVLQIPRLIAIPIIQDVLAGIDDSAWMYPAILDIVVATASPLALWMIWKTKNVYAWTFLICYFVVSVIDHGDAVTAMALARTPQTFQEMGAEGASKTPIYQTVIDLFCIVLLSRQNLRHYFKIN